MLWTINFHFDDGGEISSIKSIARDITELKRYRDQLEDEVEERTEELRKANIELRKHAESQAVLLQEMNHRVKNNLTAIIGMLQMEQNKLKRKKMFLYQPSLQDLIGRIRGLATVHTLLSATGWRPLKIEDLCRQVATATIQGLPLEKRIDVQISSSQTRINSGQAHHVTMVIHELVTNTMKYALEGRQKAAILIEIEQQNDTTQIRFKDDGPGYHKDLMAYRELSEILQLRNCELRKALDEIKVLRGMLPICSYCKKSRDAAGDWNQIEDYIRMRSEAKFTQSICPDCEKEHYPEISVYDDAPTG